jgi:hypothetical protein
MITPCILLTTTIDIDSKLTHVHQKNKQERLDIYLNSIKKWLTYTLLPIVVVENSGYTFSEINSPRLEKITFHSTDYNYDKDLDSKGVHEAFSIMYALKHSVFLKKCSHFIKVTGRYFIPSLEPLLQNIPYSCTAIRQHDTTRCEIVGCEKSIAPFLFKLPMILNGTLEPHVESVYQDRINQLSDVITLPILNIEPTKRGCNNETYNAL